MVQVMIGQCLLKHLCLSPPQELSKITMPLVFNEPISFLQRVATPSLFCHPSSIYENSFFSILLFFQSIYILPPPTPFHSTRQLVEHMEYVHLLHEASVCNDDVRRFEVHGGAWRCQVMHGGAWWFVVMHGDAWGCMVVHGCAW